MHTIWMTGMCQSGKSTLAAAVEKEILKSNEKVEVLDGDAIRKWAPTGFDSKSVNDHLRRVALICHYLNKHGIFAIVPVISPLEEVRAACREIVSKERFSLVFVDTPAKTCAKLDQKGIWKDAELFAKTGNRGVANLAGYDAPFDKPDTALDYVIYSPWPRNVDEEAERIWDQIQQIRNRPSALYVGRWQPFHNGHASIIEKAIETGERVVVGVRKTPRDKSNPFPFYVVQQLVHAKFRNDVEVVEIPDISSINIGRNVGYSINEVEVPNEIKGISATEIRNSIINGDDEWKTNVPTEVIPVIEKFSFYLDD